MRGETSIINLILVWYEFFKALQSKAVMMLSALSRCMSIKTKTPRPSETTYETAMLVTPHPRHSHFELWMLCKYFQLWVGAELQCKNTPVNTAQHGPRTAHPSLRVSRIYTVIHNADARKLQAGFANANGKVVIPKVQPFDHFHIRALCLTRRLSNTRSGKARYWEGGWSLMRRYGCQHQLRQNRAK